METFVIVAYCASDDAKKILNLKDDVQTKVGMAQIMTTVLTAAKFFGGNHKNAQEYLYDCKYFHHKLSPSQFNRRYHNIPDTLMQEIMGQLAHYAKSMNESFDYAIDSFPVAVCDNMRISRCKLFKSEKYRGKIASKKRYFYGVRVHVITSLDRMPVEFKILPGGMSDVRAMKYLHFDLPDGSEVGADKGYTDYAHEDMLKSVKNISLNPIRKRNSKRRRDPFAEAMIRKKRKKVETTFSSITELIPRSIHAVTQLGFLKKVACFVLAYSLGRLAVTT
jgi:hypothetical protein